MTLLLPAARCRRTTDRNTPFCSCPLSASDALTSGPEPVTTEQTDERSLRYPALPGGLWVSQNAPEMGHFGTVGSVNLPSQ